MYKYSCRKCPIRNRCIDESKNSSGFKTMIRNAFEARTDTLAVWGHLQKDCLLLKAEQERSTSALSNRLQKKYSMYESDQTAADEKVQPPSPSALSNRLLKAQQTKESEPEDEEEQSTPATKPKNSVIRRLRPKVDQKKTQQPDYLRPVSPSKTTQSHPPLKSLSSAGQLTQRHRTTHWLWVKNSERPITLPHIGNLVLGRFDPNVGIPPDIDLNYEDQRDYIISRRHARIIGQKGQHSIEDLGSKAGIYLNGEILQKGASPVLKADDEVFLGNIQLDYVKIPTDILKGIKSKQMRHTFTITPTGRKVVVDPQGETVIGRADPHLTFVPDIDLREEGHLADRVSRRHVIIRWRKGIPFLEDLGSSFGTRLLGEMLPLGRSVVLNPGDHIWLAGCVLAYNLELEKEME